MPDPLELALNLQNVDELHLNAPGLWVEWFPCTRPEVLSRYVDAVRGVLAGTHRILQHHRQGRLIKSYLQRPAGTSWATIARYYPGISLPFRTCETTVVANSPAVHQALQLPSHGSFQSIRSVVPLGALKSRDLDEENVDTWLRLYDEQMNHIRHHGSLRAQSTNRIVAVSAPVLAVPSTANLPAPPRYRPW